MAKYLSNFFKLATNDLANQYALPVKSLTGSVLTRRCAAKSRFLNKIVVDQMKIGGDDKVLEIGYGRGDGIRYCLNKLGADGKGLVFGIERSSYMTEVVEKKFILEVKESGKLRLDHAMDLGNLPYPSDFFNHLFHVDVFYFLHQDRMLDICQELNRVLLPGSTLYSAMQFSRLRKLSEWRILSETQWDPMRYMSCLEPAGFTDVQITYHEDEKHGQYELISARKPFADEKYYDPEERMRQLELRIKRDLLAQDLMKSGKTPTNEDLDILRDEISRS